MSSISKEKISASASFENYMEWTAEEEIQLFFALVGSKPVGVNKHFNILSIADSLTKSLNRDVPTDAIWTHLNNLYSLKDLDVIEPLPFPNEEKDFYLPDQEFSNLLLKKRAENNDKVSTSDAATVGPPSIIAVATDNTGRDKSTSNKIMPNPNQNVKEIDKKVSIKMLEVPKRAPKRTRGSMSLESNSPSTTPPPVHTNKRRRI